MNTQEQITAESGLILRDGIRLRKTQKGYTWDICISGLDVGKLKEIDEELNEEWGNGESEENEDE